MNTKLHLIKICVGAKTVEDLIDWQASAHAKGPSGHARHITRMWPKRVDELLGGGSMYWVFKGLVLCRQRIISLDKHQGEDGIARCAISFDCDVVRVAPVPKRPFQGWRYLHGGDAPPDLTRGRANEPDLPANLQIALAEIGVF